MQLTAIADKFIAVTSYEERAIPRAARFRWDPQAKHW